MYPSLFLFIQVLYTYIDYSSISPKILQLVYKNIYIDKKGRNTMLQEIDYSKLGRNIKSIRISKGLTQDNLAELVSCNTSHISNIENNHTKVSLNVLLAIANSLNTSIDYLLSDQYENSSLALDNEILRVLANCDNEKKEKILKIIEII